MSNPAHYLYDVAEHTGLAHNSVKSYHKKATTNRAAAAKPGGSPEPDVFIGTRDQYAKPGWAEAATETWLDKRPRVTGRTAE